MTLDEARAVVVDVFRRIAPEADFSLVDEHEDLRDQLDVDSMDFLNALLAIEARTGIAIPEADYGEVDTMERLVAYLVAHQP
jgi:acyl carrier protein